MSAYTWSLYRADLLPHDRILRWMEDKKKSIAPRFDKTYEQYAGFFRKMHDSYIDMGFTEDELKQLESKENYQKEQKLYKEVLYQFDKVKSGKMNVAELAKSAAFDEVFDCDCAAMERIVEESDKSVLYINGGIDEIFRCRAYSEDKFTTVDSIINFLKSQKGKNNIMDFNGLDEYGDLTDALEQKIRKHYSAFGDGNFIVEFG